jgi:hypothetical protein
LNASANRFLSEQELTQFRLQLCRPPQHPEWPLHQNAANANPCLSLPRSAPQNICSAKPVCQHFNCFLYMYNNIIVKSGGKIDAILSFLSSALRLAIVRFIMK